MTVPADDRAGHLHDAVVAFIVYVERSERRIPVQYAKRVVGRKVMGGQSTHLPLRVNAGGVMPVIFASSILTLAADHRLWLAQQPVLRRSDSTGWAGASRCTRCSMPSASFSSHISTSRSCSIRAKLRTTCGSTADSFPAFVRANARQTYINEVLTRITLVGALYLIVISFIPEWMITGIHLNHLYGPIGAVLRESAELGDEWFGRELLFRRHVAADRGGRGHGYGDAD